MGVSRACLAILFAAYLIVGLRNTNAQTVSAPTVATERLKVVLSKIAPMERWDLSSSANGPIVCWELFRPAPDLLAALFQVIQNFQGHSKWAVYDSNCLHPVGGGAFTAMPGNVPSGRKLPPAINAEDALSDLGGLADAIERELQIKDTKPNAFSPSMLTREGCENRGRHFKISAKAVS